MSGPRGTNLLDGGAPFYGVYECKDGGWMSVGCLEPQFFEVFIDLFLKSLPKDFLAQREWKPTLSNRDDWPKLLEFLEQGFLTNTRDYWTKVYHGASTKPTTSRKSFDVVPQAPKRVRFPFLLPWKPANCRGRCSRNLTPLSRTISCQSPVSIKQSGRRYHLSSNPGNTLKRFYVSWD